MSHRERQVHLPEDLESVSRGRHFVRDALLEWDLEALVEDAQLATSELVANAVRHAKTELTLTIRVDDVVTVAIRDGQPELRRPIPADSDYLAENGRGLHIVAAVADDWGITTAVNGKIVWFVMARPDASASDADLLQFARSGPASRTRQVDTSAAR